MKFSTVILPSEGLPWNYSRNFVDSSHHPVQNKVSCERKKVEFQGVEMVFLERCLFGLSSASVSLLFTKLKWKCGLLLAHACLGPFGACESTDWPRYPQVREELFVSTWEQDQDQPSDFRACEKSLNSIATEC